MKNQLSNEEYWRERIIKQDKKENKDNKETYRKLKKYYKLAREEIKKELAYFYANNKDANSYEYQLDATMKAIDKALNTMYQNEEGLINNRLIEAFKDTYKNNDEVLNINNMFHVINDNFIEQVIKTKWSGENFSERIWEDKRLLVKIIRQEIQKGLIRGESLANISNILSKKLNNSFSNSQRLIRTEVSYIRNEATKKNYEDNNITKYQIEAFLDSKTSDICKKMDGKIFNTKDGIVSKNMPPFHPNCRSCIIPIIE